MVSTHVVYPVRDAGGAGQNITEQCQPFAPHSGAEEKEKVSSHKCWGGIGRQPRAMYIAHTT
jgi:hypothetical protein